MRHKLRRISYRERGPPMRQQWLYGTQTGEAPHQPRVVFEIRLLMMFQSNAGSVRIALLTPKQAEPLRCRWIVRGRKRSWNSLRQSKTPQPQYRPPFHPFDAHAHGSLACRGACMLRCLDKCKQCFARSLHVSQSRSVRYSSSPSPHPYLQ